MRTKCQATDWAVWLSDDTDGAHFLCLAGRIYLSVGEYLAYDEKANFIGLYKRRASAKRAIVRVWTKKEAVAA